MSNFLQVGSVYLHSDEVESLKELYHSDSVQVHINTKSGRTHVAPVGVPASFIITLLDRGEEIDVKSAFENWTSSLRKEAG